MVDKAGETLSLLIRDSYRLSSFLCGNCFIFFRLQNDTVTVRTRKFMTNRLLQRKQMVSRPHVFTFDHIRNLSISPPTAAHSSAACSSCRSSMCSIPARPQSPRLKSGRSSPKCTRPPLMSFSSLASGPSLVAVRQQVSPWCTTP